MLNLICCQQSCFSVLIMIVFDLHSNSHWIFITFLFFPLTNSSKYRNKLVSGDSHLIYFKTSSFASLSCLLSCLLAYFTFYSVWHLCSVCVDKYCEFIRGKKATSALWITDLKNKSPKIWVYNRLIKHICVFPGKLYGRGSTDDKGPVLAWFNCIEAYQKIQKVKIFTSAFLPHYFCNDKSDLCYLEDV